MSGSEDDDFINVSDWRSKEDVNLHTKEGIGMSLAGSKAGSPSAAVSSAVKDSMLATHANMESITSVETASVTQLGSDERASMTDSKQSRSQPASKGVSEGTLPTSPADKSNNIDQNIKSCSPTCHSGQVASTVKLQPANQGNVSSTTTSPVRALTTDETAMEVVSVLMVASMLAFVLHMIRAAVAAHPAFSGAEALDTLLAVLTLISAPFVGILWVLAPPKRSESCCHTGPGQLPAAPASMTPMAQYRSRSQRSDNLAKLLIVVMVATTMLVVLFPARHQSCFSSSVIPPAPSASQGSSVAVSAPADPWSELRDLIAVQTGSVQQVHGRVDEAVRALQAAVESARDAGGPWAACDKEADWLACENNLQGADLKLETKEKLNDALMLKLGQCQGALNEIKAHSGAKTAPEHNAGISALERAQAAKVAAAEAAAAAGTAALQHAQAAAHVSAEAARASWTVAATHLDVLHKSYLLPTAELLSKTVHERVQALHDHVQDPAVQQHVGEALKAVHKGVGMAQAHIKKAKVSTKRHLQPVAVKVNKLLSWAGKALDQALKDE